MPADRSGRDGRRPRTLAYPLPAIVIAELLGAPPQDRELFQRWSDDIVAFQGTGRAIPESVPRSARGISEMRAYLADLVAQRRLRPTDDVLGDLVAAEMAGERLTVEELYSTCVTFLIGGHETTTSLIANGLYTLLRHPDQLARLRADPGLMSSAIEECLRFESPIQRTFRRVARDTEFGGRRLRRGQIAIQLLGAGNRDPGVFPEPARFDIERTPQPAHRIRQRHPLLYRGTLVTDGGTHRHCRGATQDASPGAAG